MAAGGPGLATLSRTIGTITPPGSFVPSGNIIGKSATLDIGSTAPPGSAVPAGRLEILLSKKQKVPTLLHVI